MKSKTLFILAAVVALLGGVAYWLYQEDGTTHGGAKMGARLFADLPMDQIDTLNVVSPEMTVTVSEKKGTWGVQQRFHYPADFPKVIRLVERIANLKSGRNLKATDANLTKLALHNPDDLEASADTRGVRIMLTGGGQTFADFLVGRERAAAAGSGGHYVFPVAGKTIHLVDQDLKYLEKQPAEWLRKEIVDIPGEAVRRIDCLVAGTNDTVVYTLERPQKGRVPEFLTPKAAAKLNASKAEQLFGALSSFEMIDVAQRSGQGAPPIESRLEYHLYDGRVYTVQPAGLVTGQDDQYAVRMTVHYSEKEAQRYSAENAGATPQKVDSTLPQAKAPAVLDPATVGRENGHFEKWEFRISKWAYEGFITKPEELLEEEKQAEPKG